MWNIIFLFSLLHAPRYIIAVNHITSFTINNDVYTKYVPVTVSAGDNIIFVCEIDSVTSSSRIAIINDAMEHVASTNQSNRLSHTMRDVTCDAISGYICEVVDDVTGQRDSSYTDVMVERCTARFCYNTTFNATFIGRLGSDITISVCAIINVLGLSPIGLWINDERINLLKPHKKYFFGFERIGISTMHYRGLMTVRIRRPEDFGLYRLRYKSASIDNITYSFNLIGEGDRCPKDWCEVEDSKCIHLEEPVDNVTRAIGVCESYGGQVLQDRSGSLTRQCIKDKLGSSREHVVLLIEEDSTCLLWDVNTNTINATICYNNTIVSHQNFICQLPFWAPWPPKVPEVDINTRPKNESQIEMPYTVMTGAVSAVIGISVIMCVVIKIKRAHAESEAAPSPDYETTLTTGQEDRYHLIDNYDNLENNRPQLIIRRQDGYYTLADDHPAHDVTSVQDFPPSLPPKTARRPDRHVYDDPDLETSGGVSARDTSAAASREAIRCHDKPHNSCSVSNPV